MNAKLRSYLTQGEQAALRYGLGVPKQAPLGMAGSTIGSRAGASLEFRDHRSYEPGDDLRHIDWGAFARTDQLTVKLFREEVTPHLDVVLDTSRSMNLEGSSKGMASAALASFFATAAARSGYAHMAWQLADVCRPIVNGNKLPGLWDELAFDFRGTPGSLPAFRPRATRVLISDLLWPVEPAAVVRPFAERAAVAVVLQVLARADIEPPEGRSVRLIDAETDQVREIHVDALVARRYRDNLARHQENWLAACRQVGALYFTILAEDLLKGWNLDFLVAAEVLRVQ